VLGSGNHSPLLPYLLAPAFAIGCLGSRVMLWCETGLVATVLIPGAILVEGDLRRDELTTSLEWLLLSVAAGVVALWVQRVLDRSGAETSYDSAHRLLSQLRTVSRQLPGGLDAVALAADLVAVVRSELPGAASVGVYASASGDRLSCLSRHGDEAALPWRFDIRDDEVCADAWTSQQARTSVADNHVELVVPLVVGLRSMGLVVAQLSEPPQQSQVTRLLHRLQSGALRLETALLFAEVRDVATSEERRRLAREIHDGVAQEIASLGYAVDDLTARARRGDEELPQRLVELRSELTRVVQELRLSIFELRTEVANAGGLGAALSGYVQDIGASSGLRVHLSLDESAGRLHADAEAELLRIAQEAITNARKHAGAANLWVTVVVDPPVAVLRVEDDGTGLKEARLDSFGLEIMDERARRLGAVLTIRPREPLGTTVEVTVGGYRDPAAREVSAKGARS
jgi:signal transduction histidine kinase